MSNNNNNDVWVISHIDPSPPFHTTEHRCESCKRPSYVTSLTLANAVTEHRQTNGRIRILCSVCLGAILQRAAKTTEGTS